MKHLKKKTKSNIVKACADLAEGYQNGKLSHQIDECPMCMIYMDQDTNICDSNCPNKVFEGDKKAIGCSRYACNKRRHKFDNLNWENSTNNLEIFWTKVGAYLEKKDEADVLNMTVQVKERIQEIARDVNKM